MDIETLELPTKNREVIEMLNDYAVGLRSRHQNETAIVALKRALALDSMVPEVWANLGCVLMNKGDYEAALGPMEKAVRLGPEKAIHWGNLALLYGALRRYEQAEHAYEECIKRATSRKDIVGAKWDRSLMRLEQGRWEEGFDEYESRIEKNGLPLYPEMPVPLWKGETLDGKTLYVQAEQGIGDRILLSRYFSEIHRRWPTARIISCVNEKMADLFWEFSSFVSLLPQGIPWPDMDYAVFMASLPSILSPSPGLVPPDPGLILKRCTRQRELGTFNCPEPHIPSLKVGIAWTGNPTQGKNHERSIPLELLVTLAENPNVVLYSFQVGPGSERIIEIGADQLVFPLGDELEKCGLVAAGVAMLDMDLIITVCTSTAHLAGALGVPTWTLLCYDPYWIWMQGSECQSTTLWYPNMRLFRQNIPGDWNSVISEVRDELNQMCAARQGVQTIKGKLING